MRKVLLAAVASALLVRGRGLYAQPLGPEFRVNTYATSAQTNTSVAIDSSGNFVVVWQSRDQAGLGTYAVFGQRYDSSGARLGAEFRVSTSTVDQKYPRVAARGTGDFVVVWQTGAYPAAMARRFASSGAPLDVEFKANASGAASSPRVASNAVGDVVIVWTGTSASSIGGQSFSGVGPPL